MTKEEIRLQVAISVIQGVLEAKHGVIGEVVPSVAVAIALRIADAFVEEWYRETKDQEQPEVELEKEIDKYFSNWQQGANDEGCFNAESQLVSIYDCHRIARYFYELGKTARKEKKDIVQLAQLWVDSGDANIMSFEKYLKER